MDVFSIYRRVSPHFRRRRMRRFVATLGVTVAGSEFLFVFALAMAFLCLVTPFVTLLFVAIDPGRRGIHDRLARIEVVRL